MTTQTILNTIAKSEWVNLLKEKGFETFVVGGAVRDLLLQKHPKDIDLIVTGGIKIDDLVTFLNDFGTVKLVGESFAVIKFIPTGIELDEPLDVAIPRAETKIAGGHKGFEISTDNITLEQDLSRRDFTINSIAMTLDGNTFVDPFNGINDIKCQHIRATNPLAFIDDPLRILRAVQFSSRFKFTLTDETLDLMTENISLLREISGERILEEFNKIIVKKGSVTIAFKLLTKIGFFEAFKLKTNKFMSMSDENFTTLGDFMHMILFFEENKHKLLAELFKADNDTKKQVKALDTMHKMDDEDKRSELIAAAMVKITPDAFQLGQAFSTVKDILFLMQKGELPAKITDLDITGDELKEMGLVGKEVGDALQMLFEMVLFKQIPNTNSVLISVMKKMKSKWGNQLQNRAKQFICNEELTRSSIKETEDKIEHLQEHLKGLKSNLRKTLKSISSSRDDLYKFVISDFIKEMKESEKVNDVQSYLKVLYENRPLEEKHLSFSEYTKLLELRDATVKEIERNKEDYKYRIDAELKKLKVGDLVRLRTKINGHQETLNGWLAKIHDDGCVDVKTGLFTFTHINVSWGNGRICKRHVEDLSHVVIPKELTTINTKSLLHAYKTQAHTPSGNAICVAGKWFSIKAVKAELNKREDIPSKNVKKFFRKK